ncbi:response regulator with CheY-like receiver, AAA-type ATPase, and DNA-binding domains [Chthonomonas calidirosea]|uniref:response regulator n=1 Tax=Chthonomonas calidirosea TaxID=454171 RepID=UPI00039DC6AB|nr:response regulator [Chthonomonas calidirosea]CEK20720.1 response regulator with CheY-like receiver, AAA-type ATPase, and DNA-binding domains [Chthonomonas calidirosea]
MAETPLASRTLLVVDDDRQQTDLLRQLISRHGYRVLAVRSAQEALDLIRCSTESIDLVITDITMPDMTGLELAQRLLIERPELPIILVSGIGIESESTDLEGQGFGFETKAQSLPPTSWIDCKNPIEVVNC